MNPADPDPQSEMKNITPVSAVEPAVPVVPDTALMPATAPAAAPPPFARAAGTLAPPRAASRRPLIVAAVLSLVFVLGAYKLFHHHRSAYEATADAVTSAIVADNMGPVVHKFSDRLQSQLLNHAHVGQLADSLTPLGAFKGSRETTPPGSVAGFHEFDETFANATWDEKYQLDSDGKIVRFHIGPKPTSSP